MKVPLKWILVAVALSGLVLCGPSLLFNMSLMGAELVILDLVLLGFVALYIKLQVRRGLRRLYELLVSRLSTWMPRREAEKYAATITNPNITDEEALDVALALSKEYAERVLMDSVLREARHTFERVLGMPIEEASRVLEAYRRGELVPQELATKGGKRRKRRKVEVRVARGGSTGEMGATAPNGASSPKKQPQYVAVCEEHGELTREEVFEDEVHGIPVLRCIYCGHIVKLC